MNRSFVLGLLLVSSLFAGEYTVDNSPCFLYNNFYEMNQDGVVVINVDTEYQMCFAYFPNFSDYEYAIVLSPDFSIEFSNAVDKFNKWFDKAVDMGNVELNKQITSINVNGAMNYLGEWQSATITLKIMFLTRGNQYMFGVCHEDEVTTDNTVMFTKNQIKTLAGKISPESLMGLMDKAVESKSVEDQFK